MTSNPNFIPALNGFDMSHGSTIWAETFAPWGDFFNVIWMFLCAVKQISKKKVQFFSNYKEKKCFILITAGGHN